MYDSAKSLMDMNIYTDNIVVKTQNFGLTSDKLR